MNPFHNDRYGGAHATGLFPHSVVYASLSLSYIGSYLDINIEKTSLPKNQRAHLKKGSCGRYLHVSGVQIPAHEKDFLEPRI